MRGAVEGGVVGDGPVGEAVLKAEGHFGGGGFGEGEALDLGRVGAGEHEAEHAVDEELGLAGAGGGLDEGGDGRVGSDELLVDGALLVGLRRKVVVRAQDGAHQSSSAMDHSATRASWA